jgi:hypothetical protein
MDIRVLLTLPPESLSPQVKDFLADNRRASETLARIEEALKKNAQAREDLLSYRTAQRALEEYTMRKALDQHAKDEVTRGNTNG